MHTNSVVTFTRHTGASGITSAKDTRKGGMGNAENSMKLLALAYESGVLLTLARNPLKRWALTDAPLLPVPNTPSPLSLIP
jgi:hypothetical protein